MTTNNASGQIRPPSARTEAANRGKPPASDPAGQRRHEQPVTRRRRHRRLAAAAAAVLLLLLAAAGVTGVLSSHHYQWKATHQARQHFHVTSGAAELTVPAPAPGEVLTISAGVGTGALTVDLPAGTTARVTSEAGLGGITTPQGDTGGLLRHKQIQIGSGDPQVIIEAGVRIGSVTIRTPEPLNQ